MKNLQVGNIHSIFLTCKNSALSLILTVPSVPNFGRFRFLLTLMSRVVLSILLTGQTKLFPLEYEVMNQKTDQWLQHFQNFLESVHPASEIYERLNLCVITYKSYCSSKHCCTLKHFIIDSTANSSRFDICSNIRCLLRLLWLIFLCEI